MEGERDGERFKWRAISISSVVLVDTTAGAESMAISISSVVVVDTTAGAESTVCSAKEDELRRERLCNHHAGS